MRLDTCWSWQRTVRFYMAAGMWVYMWKRDLNLCSFPRMPPPHIEIGDRDPVLCRVRVWVVKLLPQAAVTRTGAGHFLQEEVPAQIALAIRSVLSSLS